ncbi:DUF2971 domain-containing protein [Paraburkholderia flagellata]|uniref:DUF2971 domain-containing protein n=1 Tax=Paraburkholderia flagellata TaxID=2883241 RepID=UPI001F2487E4|nr:DUF2971 domain-containing protein [Paraburkholderia flagellata]
MTGPTQSFDPNAPDILLYEHFWRVQKQFLARQRKAFEEVETLYHYTTAEGFKSILDGREFWATHIAHLNDSSELEYGLTLLKDRLGVLEAVRPNEYVRLFVERAREQFRHAAVMLFRAYVVCFCENGNLLSQWRGYASGGGGYSIGLSRHLESPILSNGEANLIEKHGLVQLRKILYDGSEQTRLLDELLIGLVPIFEQYGAIMHRERFRVEIVDNAVMQLQTVLADLLPCFKNPSFREEQEWRYVYFAERHPVPNERFRIRNGSFVPYIPLRLLDSENGPLRVAQAFCGPTLNPELAIWTVHELAGSLGYTNVDVRPSGIPLRF